MKRHIVRRALRAFTLIELLVVIAIIAILAAILLPVFATVRESARQSSTMSNLHSVYLGARLFYEDEGRYPNSLFGYAEVSQKKDPTDPSYNPNGPFSRPAMPGDTAITPMDQATGNYSTLPSTAGRSLNRGFLYREQVKDFNTFVNTVDPVAKQQTGKTQITQVQYPAGLPNGLGGQPVQWTASSKASGSGCDIVGDSDLPSSGNPQDTTSPYATVAKMFYTMDSMDIGPAIDVNGHTMPNGKGGIVYELHYSPDWTHERYVAAGSGGGGCDVYNGTDPRNAIAVAGQPIVNQLKYKNPPTERTVLTYVTDHVAFSNSNNVLILLLSGTARTMNYKQAFGAASGYNLPLGYH